MARRDSGREIPTIERQVQTPNLQVKPNTAFAAIGEATSELGFLLANKLQDQAIYQSGIAGQVAADEGRAPKTLLPPITKASAAYNEALINTESRNLATKGRELMLAAYTEQSNPASFNNLTPAAINASLDGIQQGILDSTRPENRALVKNALTETASKIRVKVLDDAIAYDNKQTEMLFTRDTESLIKDLEEAILTENHTQEQFVRAQLAQVINDYGTINQQIKNKTPDIIKKIEDKAIITREVGRFLTAQEEGRADQYLSNFAQEEHAQLTTEQKYTALSKMIEVKNTVDSATNQTRATAKQILINDIDDPFAPTHITSLEQLQSRPAFEILSPLQQEQTISHFINSQKATINKQAKYAEAYKEISLGRAGAVDKSTINDLFTDARTAAENELGRPLSLGEQFDIVTSLQTNVPDFDRLMNSKFTSMDVQATTEAAQLYSTLRLSNQTNLLNLTGDAAVVAEKMATLLNGTAVPQEDSVKQVMNAVLKKSDPIIAERNAAATKLWDAKGPSMYKSVFGVAPDPFADNGAYKVFQEQFLAAFANGATQDEAARIARDGMREWGDDPFFVPGTIGQFPPSQELPLSQNTQAVRNQIIVGVDSIIAANNKGISPDKGALPIRFVGTVNIPDKMSQEDFVYKSLDIPATPKLSQQLMSAGLPGFGGAAAIGEIAQDWLSGAPPIMIEVNGVKSDLRLISSPQTKAAGRAGLVYGVFAKDKFGIYQQLSDPRNEDGLAYIVLRDLDAIAPELFEGRGDERLMDTFKRARDAQLKQAARDEMFNSLLGSGKLGKGVRKVIETLPLPKLAIESGLGVGVALSDKGELTIDELKAQIEANKPNGR